MEQLSLKMQNVSIAKIVFSVFNSHQVNSRTTIALVTTEGRRNDGSISAYVSHIHRKIPLI